jgi:thioredoxin-dependent peroxiredoxin
MKRSFRFFSAWIILAGLVGAPSMIGHATPAEELKPGDQAPDFTLPGTDGKTHTLSQLKGQTVVLAWFPKAFTGG